MMKSLLEMEGYLIQGKIKPPGMLKLKQSKDNIIERKLLCLFISLKHRTARENIKILNNLNKHVQVTELLLIFNTNRL